MVNSPSPQGAGARVGPISPQAPRVGRGRGGSGSNEFLRVFERQLKITTHARQRMESDGVEMDDDQRARVNRALDRVSQRGGKKSLVLLDDTALIVNVEKRTLITAIPGERRGDGVFTDIDSAVIAE
ncbi:MAG: flagellar biosynthesis protein [Clostridia bacterium]